jgi:hypothetical protein
MESSGVISFQLMFREPFIEPSASDPREGVKSLMFMVCSEVTFLGPTLEMDRVTVEVDDTHFMSTHGVRRGMQELFASSFTKSVIHFETLLSSSSVVSRGRSNRKKNNLTQCRRPLSCCVELSIVLEMCGSAKLTAGRENIHSSIHSFIHSHHCASLSALS